MNRNRITKKFSRLSGAMLAAVVWFSNVAQAQTSCFWTNTSAVATTPWSNAGNWTNNAPVSGGGSSYALYFNAGSGSYSSSNDFTVAFTNNRLIFGAGAATVYGTQLSFINNGTTQPVVTNFSPSKATINNNLLFATNVTFSQAATSTTTVNGAISGRGTLVNMGKGRLVLAGSAPNTPLTVRGGTVDLNGGSCSNVLVATTAGDNATLTITNNAQVYGSANTFYIAQGAGSTGIVNQSGGVVNAGGSAPLWGYTGVGVYTLSGGIFSNVTSYIGLGYSAGSLGVLNQSGGFLSMGNVKIQLGRQTAGSYGFYNMSDGVSSNGSLEVGSATGSLGIYYQSGGTNIQGSGSLSGFMIGALGTGVVYQTGGLTTFAISRAMNLGYSGASHGEYTLDGGTNIVGIAGNNSVIFNNSAGSTSVNTLNLNGGLLQAKAMYKGADGGLSVVNFNGGTFQASTSGTIMGPGVVAGSGFTNALDAAYVQSGGAIFDTQGYTVTNTQNLLMPTGSGVTGITLGGNVGGYVGVPYVQLTGGGGTGATAVALFDFNINSVTGIVVTSAGSGYSSQPSVTLISGGIASTTLASPASIGTVSSGGLVKKGSGTLVLTGTNTYAGATLVSNGVLRLDGSLANANLTVVSGATLAGTGAIRCRVGSGASHDLIDIQAGGTPTLSGLTLAFDATSRPVIGSYVIAQGLGSAQFKEILLPVWPGYSFKTSYADGKLSIRVTAQGTMISIL